MTVRGRASGRKPGMVARAVSPDYPKIKAKLSYGLGDWAITEAEAHEVLVILAGLGATDLADTLAELEKDGLAGRLLDNISAADRSAFSSLIVSVWQARVPPHGSLAVQAETLSAETITMDSYQEYQDKTRKWFFSPNNALDGRASKPARFDTWADWSAMHWQSRQVIADLAGLDPATLAPTAPNLSSLKAAYASWPAGKLAVFQSGTSATNTCNVFLGDALFTDGKSQTEGGKYYSAEQVFNATGRFTAIPSAAASRGDIAAWDYGHVEVVTSVNHGLDEFCSRGGFRRPIGEEKCVVSRKISDPKIHFLRIK